MKHSKMKLRLLKSKPMDADASKSHKAHGTIRMSSAARKHFCPESPVLCITVGDTDFRLITKQAYAADLRQLDGKNYNVGFVTTETYNKVEKARGESKVIWLSEDVSELIVGSDPEFGLIDPAGLYVYANKQMKASAGAKFGTDGPCMEIRADPSNSVEAHVGNIRSLIDGGSKITEIKDLGWWTGATFKSPKQERRYTIGGHIHIGDPRGIPEMRGSGQTRHTIQRRVIRVLDELVGLPLTKIDNPEAGWRRQSTNYGAFGEFRPQTNRLEWRTPSALWLTHPDLAIAVIGTAKAVAEECYLIMSTNGMKADWISAPVGSKSFLTTMGCLEDSVVREKINKSIPSALTKAQLDSLYSRLRSMGTYKKYKAYIDEFIKITSISKTDANRIKLDAMRENWLASGKLVK